MPFGLTTFQALTIAAPILGGTITLLIYQLQYDKQEYSRIATLAESKRWDALRTEYGKLVSKHHSKIANTANLFIELNDPESYADAMVEVVDDPEDFKQVYVMIREMNQPKKFHSRCRKGAELAPLVWLVSTIIAVVTLFVEGFLFTVMVLAILLFALTGILLTIIFIYYRAKLNGLADEVQFRT